MAALRRSGAVLAGKTTTPELGWKAVTDSPLCGITRNSWAPSRTSGGSSGGSAAALAAGMVPLALGTDGGGSIRIPCAFCGVPGLKPTYGLGPAWPPSPFGLLAHVGPMARTVTDLALLMDVITVPDDRDPSARPAEVGRFRDALDQGIRGLRIGFNADLGYVDVEPKVAAIVGHAADRFQALGAHIEAADPGFADPREMFDTRWSAGAGRGVADLGADPSLLDPELARLAETGRRIAVLDYVAAMGRREELCATMAHFHRQYDLLLTPTLPLNAFAAGHEVPPMSGMRGWPSWTPFSYPFNLTHQPAATLPCGFTAAGLPVGLQIVGYADAQVLRAAYALEAGLQQPILARL